MKETLDPPKAPGAKVETDISNKTETASASGPSVEASFDLSGANKKAETAEKSPAALEEGEPRPETGREAPEDPQIELDSLARQSQDYNRQLDALDTQTKESGKLLSTSEFLGRSELTGRLMSTQMLNYQKQIDLIQNNPGIDTASKNEQTLNLQKEQRAAAEMMVKENEQMQQETMERAAEALGEEQEELGDVQITKLLEAYAKAEDRNDQLKAMFEGGELTDSESKAVESIAKDPEVSKEEKEEVPPSETLELLADQKTAVESWKGLTDNVDINLQLALINFATVVAQIAEREGDPKMKAVMVGVLANLTAMIGATIEREERRLKVEIKEAIQQQDKAPQEQKKTWFQKLKGWVSKLFELEGTNKQRFGAERMGPEFMAKLSASPGFRNTLKMGPEKLMGRFSAIGKQFFSAGQIGLESIKPGGKPEQSASPEEPGYKAAVDFNTDLENAFKEKNLTADALNEILKKAHEGVKNEEFEAVQNKILSKALNDKERTPEEQTILKNVLTERNYKG